MQLTRISLSLMALAILLGSVLAQGPAGAQTYKDAEKSPDGVISLPHGLTPEEMLILDEIGRTHRSTPPPSAQPL